MSDHPIPPLTDWEINMFRSMVSSRILTYLGHYGNAGLKRSEVLEANRYITLSNKLSPSGHQQEPLVYRGTRAGGFNPAVD